MDCDVLVKDAKPALQADAHTEARSICQPRSGILRHTVAAVVAAMAIAAASLTFQSVSSRAGPSALADVFTTHDLIVLADVRHAVSERLAFFSSADLFETMSRAGVRHVAIEMPRVLGRQAQGITTRADVEAFAQDVLRSGQWHFTDPSRAGDVSPAAQHSVIHAFGMQMYLARTWGLNPIIYDFNNPLGSFRKHHDFVYRCLARLSNMTWLKYGLDQKVTKEQRDAAIMRERLSHDDELAAYIEDAVKLGGGGKVVVIPGYAHAVVPNGLTDALERRLKTKSRVVAVFADRAEQAAFHGFLENQASQLAIDLSRPPDDVFRISDGTLQRETAIADYAPLNHARKIDVPAVCHQFAVTR